MRATSSLFVCLLASALAAQAQDMDVMAGSAEILCADESRAAAAACNDYCGSMACYRADDGEADTEPAASAEDCARAEKKFRQLTGREVPCKAMAACPCADFSSWPDPAAGATWYNFALGIFNRADTTCSADSSQVRLTEDGPDVPPTVALVDAAAGECRVFDGLDGRNHTLRLSAAGAAACQRLLRRAGGSLCR